MILGDGREFDPTAFSPGVRRYNAYDCPGAAEAAARVERAEGGGTRVVEATPRPDAHALLSVDLDEGVTPFSIGCPDHGLAATSRFYTVSHMTVHQLLPVRIVWRRPTDVEYARAPRPVREHYDQGGLHREVLAPGSERRW